MKDKKFAVERNYAIFNIIPADEFKAKYNKYCKNNKDDIVILLYKKPQQILDEQRTLGLINLCHDTPQGGHFGIIKTLLKLKQRYIQEKMNKTVKL